MGLQEFTDHDAGIEFALADCGAGDAHPEKLLIRKAGKPLGQGLGDGRQLNACNVGQHSPVVGIGMVGRAFAWLGLDLKNGNRHRYRVLNKPSQRVNARRAGPDDRHSRLHFPESPPWSIAPLLQPEWRFVPPRRIGRFKFSDSQSQRSTPLRFGRPGGSNFVQSLGSSLRLLGTTPTNDHWSEGAPMANDMHSDGRDTRSGAYDAVTPVNKQLADQAAHPSAAGHVDIPEGLLRERQAPLNSRTGRRPTE